MDLCPCGVFGTGYRKKNRSRCRTQSLELSLLMQLMRSRGYMCLPELPRCYRSYSWILEELMVSAWSSGGIGAGYEIQ